MIITGRVSRRSRSWRRASTCWGKFFKRLLLGRTGLRVAQSRYHLAPPMAPEDPIHGSLSDLMANDCLQSCFDLEPRAHLAHLTLLQKLLYHSQIGRASCRERV